MKSQSKNLQPEMKNRVSTYESKSSEKKKPVQLIPQQNNYDYQQNKNRAGARNERMKKKLEIRP